MWIAIFTKPRLSPVVATTRGSLKKHGYSWNKWGKEFIEIPFCGEGGAADSRVKEGHTQ